MDMDLAKLRQARRLLHADTDTQAIDRALDIVIANHEIDAVIDELFGKYPDYRAE